MYSHKLERQRQMRRVLSLTGIALSLLILLSILVYLINARLLFTKADGKSVFPWVHPPITCKTPEHQPGETTGTITSGGLKRTFLLHLPPSYGEQSQPLVISYHGYNWTS